MTTPDLETTQFQWAPQPEAAGFVQQLIAAAQASSPWLRNFGDRLRDETGTRLVDWLDHICVGSDDGLVELGFQQNAGSPQLTFEHPGGIFPQLLVQTGRLVASPIAGIKVEALDEFLKAHQNEIESTEVVGELGDPLRQAEVCFHHGNVVRIVERHGYRGFVAGTSNVQIAIGEQEKSLESFRTRNRSYDDPKAGFLVATEKFMRAAATLGNNRACDLFFRAEREFWQSKNRAAQIQHERQQALGLGWANHDHHTYRCSRQWFASLIHFLELTGFHCRERFYAGSDAGWGAQVLEHTECGIVIFADVDMTAEELAGDFAHQGLEPKEELGTVGLWCQLHGDSFLAAGMHHLECQFDFDAARKQLAVSDVKTMAPFTDFPHLRQAFTAGETWKVPAATLARLIHSNAISSAEAARFESIGAIGSHLEILERNDGYKGFNQTGISKIILETNPKHAIGE